MKMPPWSFSSLTAYETCPRRYYFTRIEKSVVDAPGEPALWGQTVHKHLEERLRSGTPLPVTVQYEGLVAPLANAPGEKLVEKQLAITADFKPTEWIADDVWCRGIVDAGVLTRNRGVLIDWKTGKRKADSDQLKLFAGLAFSHYENVNTITTAFVWLKTGEVDSKKFERKDAPAIWVEFVPRITRMQRAFETGSFPPKPSGLCANWCPVPKHKCQFSGKQ